MSTRKSRGRGFNSKLVSRAFSGLHSIFSTRPQMRTVSPAWLAAKSAAAGQISAAAPAMNAADTPLLSDMHAPGWRNGHILITTRPEVESAPSPPPPPDGPAPPPNHRTRSSQARRDRGVPVGHARPHRQGAILHLDDTS